MRSNPQNSIPISLNRALSGLYRSSLPAFSCFRSSDQPLRAHHFPVHVAASSRRRARKRLVSAAITLTLQRFLAMPRSRVFWNPNCCLKTRNGCSTLARMCALAVSMRSCSLPFGVCGNALRLPGRMATRNSPDAPSISGRLAIPW